MAKERMSFWRSVIIGFGLVSVLWIVFGLQLAGVINSFEYGNRPHDIHNLKGIIFSPFLHGSIEHLVSNTLPILILLTVLLNAYPRQAFIVLVFIHLVTGALVWQFSPVSTVHIGISGIIYGIAAFLVASGVFRKDVVAIGIAIFIVVLYGGLIEGVKPQPGISWQSHLFGALSGIVIAFFFRNSDLPEPHEFDLEPKEEERHFFDR